MEKEDEIIGMLSGDMTDSELSALETMIQEQPELQENVELYSQIIYAIKRKGEVGLRDELNVYLKEALTKKGEKKIKSRKRSIGYLSLAASLGLIMTFYFMNDTKQESIHLQVENAPIHADSATLDLDSAIIKNSAKKIK
ncbi:MAG: hypothetical protein OCD76_03270 [Reichenbachiella sp.]